MENDYTVYTTDYLEQKIATVKPGEIRCSSFGICVGVICQFNLQKGHSFWSGPLTRAEG